MKHVPSLLLCLLGIAGCDRPEPLPVYIDLSGPQVAPFQNSSLQADLGVRTIWLFQANNLIGAFPAGSVVPVLPDGADKVLAVGGVFESGLSALQSPYPFWVSQDIPLSANPLDTIRPALVFPYYPDTVVTFAFVEGFEQANLNLTSTETGANAARVRAVSSGALFGSGAGQVLFTEREYLFEAATAEFLTLPQTGNNPVYAEISFRGSNVALTTGVFFVSSGIAGDLPLGVFFPATDTWTTVYVNLRDLIRQTPQGTRFRWYLRADNFDFGAGQGRLGVLWLDNLRIVRFR